MQIKVYVPKVIEIPSEYLPALAKRAADSLGERSHDVSATRGHLVRQAVQDGLLREFDSLLGEDGTVDLVCDPGREIPLEFEHLRLGRYIIGHGFMMVYMVGRHIEHASGRGPDIGAVFQLIA